MDIEITNSPKLHKEGRSSTSIVRWSHRTDDKLDGSISKGVSRLNGLDDGIRILNGGIGFGRDLEISFTMYEGYPGYEEIEKIMDGQRNIKGLNQLFKLLVAKLSPVQLVTLLREARREGIEEGIERHQHDMRKALGIG